VPRQRLAQQDRRQLADARVGRGLKAGRELGDGLGAREGGLECGLGLAADLVFFLWMFWLVSLFSNLGGERRRWR